MTLCGSVPLHFVSWLVTTTSLVPTGSWVPTGLVPHAGGVAVIGWTTAVIKLGDTDVTEAPTPPTVTVTFPVPPLGKPLPVIVMTPPDAE